jgi:sugar/nucleoside kinase (ribokinase family)
VEVIDATGAGDAFAAGLTHGVARRWPMEACLAQGCAWGARAVAYERSVFPNDGEEIAALPETSMVKRTAAA